MTDRYSFFLDNGYWIEKGVFSKDDMQEMFYLFYDISKSIYNRELNNNKLPECNNVKYDNEGIKFLDQLIIKLLKLNKDLVGELYDTVSYSSVFLRFFTKKKIEDLTKELLNLHKTSALYGYTNRVRIDPPKDDRRTYGWHQEVFYTIPRSYYLQTWCPIIRNTTVENGTIQICPGSHKEKIANQTWNEPENRAIQILIDENIVSKYEKINLEMQVGDLLFFNGFLFHRSGTNITKNDVRFSMVGMWNSVLSNNFRAPKPNFTFRGETPKEYFNECFSK